MENNEIMNNEMELENYEIVDEIEETDENPESTDGKKILGLIAGAVVVGVGIMLYKNRKKLEAWRIRRLEKKGYKVIKIENETEYEGTFEEIGCDDETEE